VSDLQGLEARIQDAIRNEAPRGRETERIGPFLATFDRTSVNPYLSYAVPDSGAEPTRIDVDSLVAAYEARERTPRLEYIPLVAPAVEPVLVEAGFVVEGRLPLMTCAADEALIEVPEGIELLAPSTADEYRGAAEVQWEAYEEAEAMPDDAGDRLRRTTENGGVVVLARSVATKEAAGAGICTAPQDGVTELAGIGVRASFRQRGIAPAMTGWLAQEAYAKGMTLVFLMARGEAEARIYERAGFVSRSEVLHISRGLGSETPSAGG
jgi:ribosomal protein S18 acetylase RimI-like enzyme